MASTPAPPMQATPTGSPMFGWLWGSASPTASPTASPAAQLQSTAYPTPHCQDDAQFHIKDCPLCNCAWFAASPAALCPKYGKNQGVVRGADGRWHRGETACCACSGGMKAATTAPTDAIFAPVPAVGTSGGVPGCTDLVGADHRAFFIKGCETCTCEWVGHDDRCSKFAKYTGANRNADGKVLKPLSACCACGGGQRQ